MSKADDESKTEGEGTGQAAPAAAAAPAAPVEESTGLDAAMDRLRAEFGDDIATLWRTSGPRTGHVAEIAAIMVDIGDAPRRLMVQAFRSGGWNLFMQVSGKTPDQMVETLRSEFEAF